MTRQSQHNASSVDDPLNVLVATPAGGTGQGGIDRIMAALKAELERRPHGVVAHFAPTRGKGALVLSLFHLLHFCARIAGGRLRGRLDLVHINLSSRGSTYRKIVVAACARMMRTPYVVHLHGSQFRSFWSNTNSTILDRSIQSLFEKASRVIVLGTPWQAFIAEKVPEARGRIVIIPNAVEEPREAHIGGGASIHILFLGRIDERKGVPELVRALARMKGLPDWRATLAGDGAVDALRSEIAALGLADKVTVPGWLGSADTARLLATGDILTLPSHAENLPMSIIEAMASGLAVVATPVGAVEDIVKHGQTGLLVPPGDDSALADALLRLVQDAELRQRLGAAAQVFQRQHLNIGPYADAICAAWREAVADFGGEASSTAPVSGSI